MAVRQPTVTSVGIWVVPSVAKAVVRCVVVLDMGVVFTREAGPFVVVLAGCARGMAASVEAKSGVRTGNCADDTLTCRRRLPT
jgi:hypothetical protein